MNNNLIYTRCGDYNIPNLTLSEEEEISAGASPRPLEQHDPVGEAVPPSEGNRRDSEPVSGVADVRITYIGSGTGQGDTADGLGAAYERTEDTG